MNHPASLKVTTPSDPDIAVTRVFDAPRKLVFDALTKPELIRRWLLGPPGWTMEVYEIDPKVGGAYRYVWRHATLEAGVRRRITQLGGFGRAGFIRYARVSFETCFADPGTVS